METRGVSRSTASCNKLGMVSVVVCLGFMFAAFSGIEFYGSSGTTANDDSGFQGVTFLRENISLSARKLVTLGDEEGGGAIGGGNSSDAGAGPGSMDGFGANPVCSSDSVLLFQGPTSPLPNGIPTFTVDIVNACTSGCTVSNIHLSCGWFSSARLIDPRLFRRLEYDDCLVNNGDALPAGHSLSFEYANNFPYPLAVHSFSC